MRAAAKGKFIGNPVKETKNSGSREESFLEKESALGIRALMAFDFLTPSR